MKNATEDTFVAFLFVDNGFVCQVGQGRYLPHDPGNGGESLSRMVRLGEMTGKPEHRKEGKGRSQKQKRDPRFRRSLGVSAFWSG